MMACSQLHYKMLLNVSPSGLSTFQYPETILPERWDLEQMYRAFDLDGDKIMGLKLRISDNVAGERGMYILKKALNWQNV